MRAKMCFNIVNELIIKKFCLQRQINIWILTFIKAGYVKTQIIKSVHSNFLHISVCIINVYKPSIKCFVFQPERVLGLSFTTEQIYNTCRLCVYLIMNCFLKDVFFILIVLPVFLSDKLRCITTHVLFRTNDLGMASLEVRLLISDMLTYIVIRDLDY